ncbi:hypothetical protein AB4339_14020, partial [Vibrio breoganii]
MNLNKTGLAIALAAAMLSGGALADRGHGNKHGSNPSDEIEIENFVDGGGGNKQWSDSANTDGSYNDRSDSSLTRSQNDNSDRSDNSDSSDNSDNSDNTDNSDNSDSSLSSSYNNNSDNSDNSDGSDNS